MRYRVRVIFLGRKSSQGGFFEDFRTKRVAMRFYRLLCEEWTYTDWYIVLFEVL